MVSILHDDESCNLARGGPDLPYSFANLRDFGMVHEETVYVTDFNNLDSSIALEWVCVL